MMSTVARSLTEHGIEIDEACVRLPGRDAITLKSTEIPNQYRACMHNCLIRSQCVRLLSNWTNINNAKTPPVLLAIYVMAFPLRKSKK